MKSLKNNKGAAMVTVLIAVSFIIILASSLLFMSYMNYQTKAGRLYSTDMFYTAEFALDDLTSSVQQVAAISPDISTAKTDVYTALGVTTNSNGKKVYSYAAVESLIKVASQDASISINSAVPKDATNNATVDTYVVSGNSVKLVGVQVTATTAEGFTSTITSDIVLNFPSNVMGKMDINDFSLIADAPVKVEAGDVVFGGNIYIHGGPGVTALTVGSTGNVEILSNQGIIYGDVVIDGTGVLAITGNMTITGTIHVNANAVLMVTGSLRHGEIIKAPNARVLGVSDLGDMHVPTSGLPSAGLAQLLFEEIEVMDNGGSHQETITISDITNAIGWQEYRSNGPFGAKIRIGQQGTENIIDNTLVLSDKNVEIRGDYTNSTCVCSGTIVFNIPTAPTYMQRMSDESYEEAKATLMGTNGRSSFQVRSNNYSFHSGDDTALDSLPSSNCFDVTQSALNQDLKWYFDGSSNYVPFGRLIVDNSSDLITTVFGSVGGSALPSNTTIIYDNWSKE